MTTYRSKIDIWLMAVMGAATTLPLLIAWLSGDSRTIPLMVFAGLAALLMWLCYATRYVVSADELTIHNGFYKIDIPKTSIKSVKDSRSIISSPALSLDRIEIAYGENKSILISPKNKAGFLTDIGW